MAPLAASAISCGAQLFEAFYAPLYMLYIRGIRGTFCRLCEHVHVDVMCSHTHVHIFYCEVMNGESGENPSKPRQ